MQYIIYNDSIHGKKPFSSKFLKINQFRQNSIYKKSFGIQCASTNFSVLSPSLVFCHHDKHIDCRDIFLMIFCCFSKERKIASFFYGSTSFEFFTLSSLSSIVFFLIFWLYINSTFNDHHFRTYRNLCPSYSIKWHSFME